MHFRFDFLFTCVYLGNRKISALLDSGSSINLISRYLFDKIPAKYKSDVDITKGCTLKLANNSTVHIDGECCIKVRLVSGEKHTLPVSVISNTSHPLILGVNFMRSKGVSLNFMQDEVHSSTCNVKCIKSVELLPNSETFLWGKIPKMFAYGTQGVSEVSRHLSNKGLFVAKSVVSVTIDHKVPVKVLNPTSTVVTIYRGDNLVKFCTLNSSYKVYGCDISDKNDVQNEPIHMCANVSVQKQVDSEIVSEHENTNVSMQNPP